MNSVTIEVLMQVILVLLHLVDTTATIIWIIIQIVGRTTK